MNRSVYVIKSEPGPVKIGIAAKPKKRFDALQTGSSVPLFLAYIGECQESLAAEKIEAEAHKILRIRHQRGEWFAVSVDDAVSAVMLAAQRLRYELRSIDLERRAVPLKVQSDPVTLPEILARNLRLKRREKGLSQEALAWEAGVNRSHMAVIETGHSYARINIIEKLAAALDIPPHELLMPPAPRVRKR